MDTITIGIPTYRRPDSLVKLLKHLESSEDFTRKNTEICIINDSGSEYEDSYKCKISPYLDSNKLNIRYLSNSENIGYPKTFIRLFKECKTDFLLLMADDDLMVSEHLNEILEFINEFEPDICSTQYFRGDHMYRGKIQTRKVKYSEFQQCNGHAPGVIYKVKNALEFLPDIEKRIHQQCSVASTYPQALLCIYLLLKNNHCWFLAYPLVERGDDMPSLIKDPEGNHYSSVASRIRQIADYDNFILSLPESEERNIILNSSRASALVRLFNASAELNERMQKRYGHKPRPGLAKRISGAFKKQVKLRLKVRNADISTGNLQKA